MRFPAAGFLAGIVIAGSIAPGASLAAGRLALSPQEERSQLEAELEQVEKEIRAIEKDITATQEEKNTLQNQLAILRAKIRKLDLQIYQSNKLIDDLRGQISDTSSSIENTKENIGTKRTELEEILRRLWMEDKRSPVEIVLSGDTLSEFFRNVAQLEALNTRTRTLLVNLQEMKEYLETQKGTLQLEKEEEENLVRIQLLQKERSQSVRGETESLLRKTQGKEDEYQRLLNDRQKKAQEIRTRLFELVGVTRAPTFEEALALARQVSAQTGIRPAFLLAILTQESNLGKNVGQCYMTDPATGDGIVIRTGRGVRAVMKPSRDVQPFLQITKELGRDPSETPVSCPIPSVGGYGGAMGPAQFIPSTWMMYRDRLERILGRPGDPWSIKDAFMASSLYLTDYGAAAQTRSGEWRAAMIYFSGSTNTRYRFYGDNVLAIADRYQRDIEALE